MAWTFTDDVGAYRAAVGELLSSEPERHTVLLSVLARLTRRGSYAFADEPPVLGWWPSDGAPQAAVLQTPPWPMLLTALPGESAAQLAQAIADRGATLSGLNGPVADATAVASAWRTVTGMTGRTRQRQRLYRLGTLTPPEPAPAGAARIASAADAARVVGPWFSAFTAEIGEPEEAADVVAERLDRGQLMLWEVAGEPVSMAAHTDVLVGVARVGAVFTPPDRRGRGYAGAVTAAISKLALTRGARSVILFTDLANPTSNSLYRRLGYEPVEDRAVFIFGD
jgi:predicted GNAT family acetyltransferase